MDLPVVGRRDEMGVVSHHAITTTEVARASLANKKYHYKKQKEKGKNSDRDAVYKNKG